MLAKIFILLTFVSLIYSETKLCTLAIVEKSIVIEKLKPFANYLESEIGEKVEVYVGRNYRDTLEKIESGFCAIGYIGPIPYLKIEDSVKLLAVIKPKREYGFHSDIVTRKDSKIENLSDLIGKNFAFGSPESTLSFYVPADILLKERVLSKLNSFHFLYSHDMVAKSVIIGLYDAGSIKHSVYDKYKKYLKVVKSSKDFDDFVVVANKELNSSKQNRIKSAVLNLKDEKILNSIKKGTEKFIEIEPESFGELKEILKRVNLEFQR
jgi:phosphonate transport system substrate-binding protein